MNTFKFRSEFTYELPDNTLTIIATCQMWPGHPATYYDPGEGPEIYGDPAFEITGENGESIAFDDLPESKQEIIRQMIYDNFEEVDNRDDYDHDDIY